VLPILYGGIEGNISQFLSAELIEQEAALDEQVLLTAEPRATDPTRIDQLWETIVSNLKSRFGNKAELLTQKEIPLSQQGDYCDVGLGMYQEIMKRSPTDSVILLRETFKQ
jgi:hypothetical protein